MFGQNVFSLDLLQDQKPEQIDQCDFAFFFCDFRQLSQFVYRFSWDRIEIKSFKPGLQSCSRFDFLLRLLCELFNEFFHLLYLPFAVKANWQLIHWLELFEVYNHVFTCFSAKRLIQYTKLLSELFFVCSLEH